MGSCNVVWGITKRMLSSQAWGQVQTVTKERAKFVKLVWRTCITTSSEVVSADGE